MTKIFNSISRLNYINRIFQNSIQTKMNNKRTKTTKTVKSKKICSIEAASEPNIYGYQTASLSLTQTYNNSDRNRVHTLNEVFEVLRLRIPTFPYERRLSKIDTLRLTISYIHLLQAIIQSNLTFHDYVMQQVYYRIIPTKPTWATSDLIVRLNWLNWNGLGVYQQNEVDQILNLIRQLQI